MSTSSLPTALLQIRTDSPLTEFRVTDARYHDVPLPENSGDLDLVLTQGVYQVAFRNGKGWRNQLVLLSADSHEPVIVNEPLTGSPRMLPPEAVDEDLPLQAPPSELLSTVTVGIAWGGKSGLLDIPGGSLGKRPLAIELVSADTGEALRPNDGGLAEPRLRRRFWAPPGHWFLRVGTESAEDPVEMPLVVCPRWHTRINVTLSMQEGHDRLYWDLPLTRVSLVDLSAGPADPELRGYARDALEALAGRRSLRGGRFRSLLRNLFNDRHANPMLGIYGGHLLSCVNEEDGRLLDEVIGNLRRLVNGPQLQEAEAAFVHPDVEALGLRSLLLRGQSLDAILPFPSPPMLAAGWKVLMDACRIRPDLIPNGSLTSEFAARVSFAGPWNSWVRPRQRASMARTGRSLLQVPGLVEFAGGPVAASMSVVAIGMAGESLVDRSVDDDVTGEPGDFLGRCAIIQAALTHRSLREWYRRALAQAEVGATERSAAAAPDEPEAQTVDDKERALANALRPVASDEVRQRVFDAVRVITGRGEARPASAVEVASRIGLPSTTVEDAASSLAHKLLVRARAQHIDLSVRSDMASPKLIIPYDPDFLGDGFSVPMPALSDALRAQAFADAVQVPYTHFSLVMHARRRVAIVAANNIDAARKVQVSGGLTWRMDERVGEFQLGSEVYAGNQLDRGHMVRREDVLWGTVPEARCANEATFFFANAAPQHQNFNQDEWVTLEDWVLDRATDFSYRLCVFTGPVLRDNDPTLDDLPATLRTAYRAIGQAQIPAAFWKVIVLRDGTAAGEDLSVVAFAMRQSEMWNDKQGRQLLHLKVHQVTLEAIEEWTGLDFGALKQADELQWSDERMRERSGGPAPEWPHIRSGQDIVYSGAARRARGVRVARVATVRTSGAAMRSTEGPADCGCSGTTPDGFDPRAAIEALNRDVVRLTGLLAGRMQADDTSVRAGAPEGRSAIALPASGSEEDPRVAEVVAASPDALKKGMGDFMRWAAEQRDIARGIRRPSEARELERIIGGEDVAPGAFTSCVCIGGATDWFCSGVVIAPRVVLTAAHCGSTITRVMIGGNSVKPLLDTNARVVPVQRVEVHAAYRRSPFHEYDINLLILAEDANVPPALIATPDQLRAASTIQLVGFGYNDPQRPLGFGIKRQVLVPMAPIFEAPDVASLASLEAQLGFHAAYEFVAGRKGLGIDTCNGDSGGPAYVSGPQGFRLAGLTSRATREGSLPCGDGGIYVRPDQFAEWIAQVMERAGLARLPHAA